MEHFGIKLRKSKYGMELVRENYAIINNKSSLPKNKFLENKGAYTDETGRYYTDEWCCAYRKLCLENFDLNMRFYQSLDHNKFQQSLTNFLSVHKEFEEISDLNKYNAISGYYILVLDKYCRVYIGTTMNIKRRILQHWAKVKAFDRLLLPMYNVDTSILSIDSFRALDTTRIFVYVTNNTYIQEDNFINFFPSEFVSNRLAGGKVENNFLSVLAMASTVKTHKLVTK